MKAQTADITPGTPSNKEEDRNQLLIADYIKHTNGKWKFSIVELVVKYKITAARIYAILDSYGVPRRKDR